MHFALRFLIHLLPILCVNCKEIGQREGRWFNGAFTSTVLETSVVTSLVPSSCVQTDSSLPPCRNVRYLKFPHFTRKAPIYDANGLADSKSAEFPIEITPLGWGEYLGIYAPTVTVTNTHFQTAVVQDPRIVVTFAVKGCMPLKLPMDLDRCPQVPTSTVNIEEILPTSTVASFVISSSTSSYIQRINEIPDVNNGLDKASFALATSEESTTDAAYSVESTEALPAA